MSRNHYKLYSDGEIAGFKLKNRLVRSATWDPCILHELKMTEEVVEVYRNLALGGIGLIITGSFPVASEMKKETDNQEITIQQYDDLKVEGVCKLPQSVHLAAPDCKIIAQFETDYLSKAPSAVQSPFGNEIPKPFTIEDIKIIVGSFIKAIKGAKSDGFDGVQLHAAHGGFLSSFLSPYSNRREDEYGGSIYKRVRIVREILAGARDQVGDFPILIKLNGTDYLEDGITLQNFPELAREIEKTGVDALEVSGGMWECLSRSEDDLGFRPEPSPESHTHIGHPDKQSYFQPYAEALDINIPIILGGGNRDVERLEMILQSGKIDFIAMCRPLICEPDLPNRWKEGRGKKGTQCFSCNSCLYDMYVHPGHIYPGIVHCVFKSDKKKYKDAQEWLSTWVEKNVVN